jgi:hypothetical protein
MPKGMLMPAVKRFERVTTIIGNIQSGLRNVLSSIEGENGPGAKKSGIAWGKITPFQVNDEVMGERDRKYKACNNNRKGPVTPEIINIVVSSCFFKGEPT